MAGRKFATVRLLLSIPVLGKYYLRVNVSDIIDIEHR
jgi:hypothetical protein